MIESPALISNFDFGFILKKFRFNFDKLIHIEAVPMFHRIGQSFDNRDFDVQLFDGDNAKPNESFGEMRRGAGNIIQRAGQAELNGLLQIRQGAGKRRRLIL
ncbi:MAG: hypothetical protein ALAOOOJD_02207 [bacterium]|nr:hypothetical protein [bacterium]